MNMRPYWRGICVRTKINSMHLAKLCSIALVAATAFANWPQWRGPLSNGTAPGAKNLVTTWTEKDNVQWRAKLPSWSAATPIIWENTIFVTTGEEGFSGHTEDGRASRNAKVDQHDKVFLLAMNRKDGSTMWKRQIAEGNRLFRKHNLTSPSPITDGKHVWTMTGSGKFACFTFDGKPVWERDVIADYGRIGINHGYASTPLLEGNRLYVEVIHGFTTDDPSYVFAADKLTGKNVWKVLRPSPAKQESKDSYSTPQIAVVNGKRQLVISGADIVTGHDLDTGKEMWRIGGFNPGDNPANRTIASSLVMGDKVFTPSTRGRPFIAFRAGGEGDITGKNELWTNNLGADVPTSTTDGKYIYVVNDIGIINCIEAETGKVVYSGNRIERGTYSSSPLLADGKIYCTNEEGTTTVIKAGPVFEVLGVSKLDSRTLASPVAVGDQIFIRTADYLYCIGKKK